MLLVCRHLVERKYVEVAATDFRIGATVVAARAHLHEHGLAAGAGLRHEAQLLGGVLREDLAQVQQRVAPGAAHHHGLVRSRGGRALGLVGHVDARVGHRDGAALGRERPLHEPGRARLTVFRLRLDARIEGVWLVAEAFCAYQGFELRAAAVV